MSEEFYIDEEKKDERLDKYFVSLYPHLSRGEVIRMIRSGVIEINGKKAKASYHVKGGEYVFVGDYGKGSTKLVPNRNLRVEIIDSQENFVVINKQIGVQVHPSHREKINTIINALIGMYSEIVGVGDDEDRPGIMHRLDKDTTGVMVVAKNQRTFNALKKGFQEKTIQKTYHALVFGEVDDEGIIDAPIARATSYTKQKIAFGKYAGEAKEAQTAYKKIATYRVNEEISISLIEARPKTGRMHQIRVHMAHIGHPLVGDQRYYTKIERKLPLGVLKAYDMQTFFLHAKELQFALNGVEHVYNVEYPDRFKALLRFLEEFRV